MDSAALWTDGRYFLQASTQLDKNWTLMKMGLAGTPSKEDWLIKTLPPKSRIGVDPKLITADSAKKFMDKLMEHGHELVPLDENLIDLVWRDRPARAANPVFVLPVKYTGKPAQEKFADIVQFLNSKIYEGIILTELDEIACNYGFLLKGFST